MSEPVTIPREVAESILEDIQDAKTYIECLRTKAEDTAPVYAATKKLNKAAISLYYEIHPDALRDVG
jgi:hypothetical protein